jgi:hypothetical protein
VKQPIFYGIPTKFNSDNFYKIESDPKSLEGNFYFLSNDIFKFQVKKISNLSSEYVMIGIANPHFFHVLSEMQNMKINFKRIIAIDNNYEQLVHFSRIRKIILNSQNRIEFLQNLFKVKFNSKAIEILLSFNKLSRNYVHGGVAQDSLYFLEKTLWQNLYFNEEKFQLIYNLKVNKDEVGLKIFSNTIGDINTYYVTFICCSHNNFSCWPFTAAFGSGFLRNELSYNKFRTLLTTIPIYEINADISTVFEPLFLSNRYHPILFWSSNLFCDYFVKKFPSLSIVLDILTKYGCQKEPYFPEMDIMLFQDERSRIPLPREIDNIYNHHREWSIHSKSFSKVSEFLIGSNNLEVVNVKHWIENDKGESKLPNTNYMFIDDFLELDLSYLFDSIFIHILVGHGLEKNRFIELLIKAKLMTKNLIVLEHNSESVDFYNKKIGLSIKDLRDILGMESYLTFCPGEKSLDRNILCVYRNLI